MRAKAVSGVWSESGTTADRFDRNKESAKHRMPERQSRMQKRGLRHSSGFPCYLRRLHRILFQCRYATLRLLLSTGRDSDYPPSCVVGLSQTRLSGDRQFHIFRNFQFQYIVPIYCHSFSPSWKLSSSYYAVISTQEALLAHN